MKKRVLVIDDHPEIREMYEDVLTAHNYEVRTAEDGLIGAQIAAEYEPDVILLDIMMPKMDGFTLLTSLKNSNCTAKIIVISNLDSADDEKKAIDAGAVTYLRKSSYTPDQVVVEIERILANTA
jgi:DNA-binding response OmpR family regulator